MASKKAVVVGINNYPIPKGNLPSCIDDAKAFTAALTTYYQFDQVEQLFDDRATVDAVRSRLDWLFGGAEADDQLVFYFSGHGYRTEVNGVLRECLVLYGQIKDGSYDGFFFDETLVQESVKLPPGVLTVILDSYHSGGMYKPFFIEQEGVERTENKLWRPEGPQFDEAIIAGSCQLERTAAIRRATCPSQPAPRLPSGPCSGATASRTR